MNRLKPPIVLSLCDRTGIMVAPWRDAGYRCLCVDIQHDLGSICRDGIEFVGADVRTYLPPLGIYAAAFGFPPCTHLSVSGARWFEDKTLSALHEAIGIVEATRRLCEWTESPYCIENPVSTLSTYWRKPDHTFNPCDFGGYLNPNGDAYTKKTCLWTGGGFKMPARRPVKATEGSKMHRLPPTADRADLRSETPAGFALAVFMANRMEDSNQ
jgi:hypothetical protein